MNTAEATEQFIRDLLDDFKNDDIGRIFLGCAITNFAKDISKRNPNHIYVGYIKGVDWIKRANLVLEKRALTFLD